MTSGSFPRMSFDPLSHPVAITGQSVIGDQIRLPADWCAMAGCEAAFAEPAALGEADNRARAVAAGWAKDALGRLVCPACQRDHPLPGWWVLPQEPSGVSDRGPLGVPARPANGTSQPVLSAPPERPFVTPQNPPQRTQWPRLISALVSSRDGWSARAGSRVPDAGSTGRHAQPRRLAAQGSTARQFLSRTTRGACPAQWVGPLRVHGGRQGTSRFASLVRVSLARQ